MKTFLAFLFLILLVLQNQSQDFKLSLYYLDGEKSKDSHSTEEKISISGYDVKYSVKYSGHRTKSQNDTEKNCTFSEQVIAKIKTTIISKGLNSNQTLTDENSKSKSFERYCNIALDITMDGNNYKIRINGDIEEFKNNDLYKNCDYFAKLLRKLVKDCS